MPGWAEKKVRQWCGTVREPFRVRKAARGGVARRRRSTEGGVESDGEEDACEVEYRAYWDGEERRVEEDAKEGKSGPEEIREDFGVVGTWRR